MIIEEDEICGGLGDVTSTLAHRNTDIGFAQCQGIVDAVAGHGDDVSTLVQYASDTQLLARGDTSDDRAILTVQTGCQVLVVVRQLARIQHDPTLSEQPHLAGHHGGCPGMIAGDHRYLDARGLTGGQCLCDVWSGRVLEPDQGEQAQPSLGVGLGLAWMPASLGHRQNPSAALGKIVDHIVGNRTQTPAQDGLRCAEDDGAPQKQMSCAQGGRPSRPEP